MSAADWAAELGPDWKRRLFSAADRALTSNEPVSVGRFVLVSDVLVIEAAANHLASPDTWRLVQPDGRAVSVYRLPCEEKA